MGGRILGTPFVTTDKLPAFQWEKCVYGDINLDGKLTVEDAVILQQYLLKNCEFTNSVYADVNSDGMVNVFDLVRIKRLLILL